MNKPRIFLLVFFVLGLVGLFVYFSQNMTPGPEISSEEVIAPLMNIEKYYNQPIRLVSQDWPAAQYSTDKTRNIFKNEVFSLVAASKAVDGPAYFVQVQMNGDNVCTKRNFSGELDRVLQLVGLEEVISAKPIKSVEDSKLYCFKDKGYIVDVGCQFDSTKYTVALTGYDAVTCQ